MCRIDCGCGFFDRRVVERWMRVAWVIVWEGFIRGWLAVGVNRSPGHRLHRLELWDGLRRGRGLVGIRLFDMSRTGRASWRSRGSVPGIRSVGCWSRLSWSSMPWASRRRAVEHMLDSAVDGM